MELKAPRVFLRPPDEHNYTTNRFDQGGVESICTRSGCKSLLRFLTCGGVDDGKST